jgi:hypothetical protein
MHRAALTTVLTATILMTGGPVHAQDAGGPTVVIGGDGTIDTAVVDLGASGGSKPAARQIRAGTGDGGHVRNQASGTGTGTGTGAARCEYLRLPQLDTPGPPAMQAFRYTCDDGSAGHVAVRVGADPAAAADTGPTVALITPGELAQQAFNSLQLPAPGVRLSPDSGPGRYQLVGFPTWWWVENFEPVSQRTAAGAVWAQVTATPLYSTFNGGEGQAPVRCDGPGLPWRQGLPERSPGVCSYSYQRPAETVTATVTVTWQVTWVGSGDTAGELPLVRMSTAQPLTVYERQAVVTSGHG